jgi:hypothetical protein
MYFHALFGQPAGKGIDLTDLDGGGQRTWRITPKGK